MCAGKGDEMEEEVWSDSRLKRLQNLAPYKDKTLDELREMKKNAEVRSKKEPPKTNDVEYRKKFNEKLKALTKDYAIDMNDSNDLENVRALVNVMIQIENADIQIRTLESEKLTKDEIVSLKNLGDYKRNLIMSLNQLEDKLGISRKERKEKQVDDIPKWIEGVLERAKTFYEKETVTVVCPKCQVEVGRYWLNFPKREYKVQLSLQCAKCKEMVEYDRVNYAGEETTGQGVDVSANTPKSSNDEGVY